MQKGSYDIIIFFIVASVLIFCLIAFIISMLYFYRKSQIRFERNIENLKLDYEKTLLRVQLEIQEQTCIDIAREIHDNISLSLTLAKLNLHTIPDLENPDGKRKVENSIDLITQSIHELSDISKSLNSDIIIQQGLLKAVEYEMYRIQQLGIFDLDYKLSGNPIYLEAQKEVIIFRIIQEALNNILKHAEATKASLKINYNATNLNIIIQDNGKGINFSLMKNNRESGLKNMEMRIKFLNGTMKLTSVPNIGTSLCFELPII